MEIHLRIVAVSGETVFDRLRTTAKALGIAPERLTEGNRSSNGAYQSYQLSLVVASLARMREVDQAFRGVDGVKMVL